MTRPVFEPNTERILTRYGFTDDQLLRRPYPNPQRQGFMKEIYEAPHIMVGVYDSDYADPFDPGLYGFSIWPGGLVAQALLPFSAGDPPVSPTGDNHQLLPDLNTALVTQVAASKAAAAVCFEFTAEEGGLATIPLVNIRTGFTFGPFYHALLGIKLMGTPRNVGISLSCEGKSDADFTITSASPRWGLDYFGLFEMSLVIPWLSEGPSPGATITLKAWADGADAEIHLSHIYWIPESGGNSPGPSDAPGHFHQFMGFGQYMSATATTPTGESATGSIRADNQYLQMGKLDAAYVVSFGGSGFSIGIGEANLRGIYDSDFEAARIFEPRHAYQEARINIDTRTEHSVGYAVLYKDAHEYGQVPIHSQDWGLVYWGPWHHDFQELHWGLWAPQDQDNAGTFFDSVALDDADFVDVRVSEMWFPRDIFSRPIRYVAWP